MVYNIYNAYNRTLILTTALVDYSPVCTEILLSNDIVQAKANSIKNSFVHALSLSAEYEIQLHGNQKYYYAINIFFIGHINNIVILL